MDLFSGAAAAPYVVNADVPAFFLLVGLLVLFVAMYWMLRRRHPRGRRGVEGFLEAAGVDLAFLAFAVGLVLVLAVTAPSGNRTAFALYRVVITGYWLTFAIPIVTVGSSVHSSTRGGIPWRIPSILVAILLFLALFAYYFRIA